MIPGGIANPFRIPDLRRRLIFTAAMLALFRLGAHLPVPGVNVEAIRQQFEQATRNTAFGFLDLLVGGALSNFSIFALGVIPYITASIIMSLVQIAFPNLKKQVQEEGEAGRKRIGWYTLYMTIPLAALQGWADWVDPVVLPGAGDLGLQPAELGADHLDARHGLDDPHLAG